MQALIRDRTIKVPLNLEEKIEKKYLLKLDLKRKICIKNLLSYLKETD